VHALPALPPRSLLRPPSPRSPLVLPSCLQNVQGAIIIVGVLKLFDWPEFLYLWRINKVRLFACGSVGWGGGGGGCLGGAGNVGVWWE
jgi:hypothetical protein